MKQIFIALTLLTIALGPTLGLADEGKIKEMTAQLGLSKDQIKQIKAIKDKFKPQIKELAARSCEMQQDLQKNLASETKGAEYQKQLLEKFTQLRATRGEHKLLRFKMALEIREILNKDQISKFNALQRSHGKMDKQRCGGNDNE